MSQNEDLRTRAADLADETTEFMLQLVSVREQRGLTQKAVAEALGISQPAVAQFEHYDANPTLASIRRYALAVGASLRLTAEDASNPLIHRTFELHHDEIDVAQPTPSVRPNWSSTEPDWSGSSV